MSFVVVYKLLHAKKLSYIEIKCLKRGIDIDPKLFSATSGFLRNNYENENKKKGLLSYTFPYFYIYPRVSENKIKPDIKFLKGIFTSTIY